MRSLPLFTFYFAGQADDRRPVFAERLRRGKQRTEGIEGGM
jgi:hypothetical protein